MKIRHALQLGFGVATHIPGFPKRRKSLAGGAQSARYCYSVWMRHLISASQAGVWNNPKNVAELGPGDSLGVGLAALLSGADYYFAFDVVAHADLGHNVEILDQLVALFTQKTPIPDDREFPEIQPRLNEYSFPSHILTDEHLRKMLAVERVSRLRSALGELQSPTSPIRYAAPWTNSDVIAHRSIDMIFSQAVLEHVDELQQAYEAMRKWINPTGFMSHDIDFRSHGVADQWNGHWAYSDLTWKLMRGKRPYYINRKPLSEHIHLLEQSGFHVVLNSPQEIPSSIDRSQLARSFRHLSDEDIKTSTAFIIATPSE